MKIALDFREAAKPVRAGKGEYVYQLTRSLVGQLNDDDELLLLVEADQTVALPAGRWRAVVVPMRSWAWHIWVAAWLSFSRPVNLFFATTSVIVPALAVGVPSVMTIFDFTVWRFPQTHLPRAVWIEKIFMRRALRRASHLLSISEFTKQEAIDLFRTNPAKITVTLLGADTRFVPQSLSPDAIGRLQARYGLPQKYLLCLGTLEPRKNLARVIEAFRLAQPDLPGVSLVLAGARGWKLVLDDSTDRVVLTGYIDDQDRPALYNLATALVFPSIYEGFGLPPLEAMACGTPVITSNRSSLPEVVGAAGVQVDPDSTTEIANAMVRVSSSQDLQKELRSKGLARAQQFSWERCAKQTGSVLRQHGNHHG